MMTIHSKKELKTARRRLRQDQVDLEDRIKKNWKALKEQMRPKEMVKDAMQSAMKHKTEENLESDNILKTTFNYGLSLLVKKLSDKAGEKFGKFFKKNK